MSDNISGMTTNVFPQKTICIFLIIYYQTSCILYSIDVNFVMPLLFYIKTTSFCIQEMYSIQCLYFFSSKKENVFLRSPLAVISLHRLYFFTNSSLYFSFHASCLPSVVQWCISRLFSSVPFSSTRAPSAEI